MIRPPRDRCKYCGVPVRFAYLTESGRRIAINPGIQDGGTLAGHRDIATGRLMCRVLSGPITGLQPVVVLEIGENRYMPHEQTCDNRPADRHRRRPPQ